MKNYIEHKFEMLRNKIKCRDYLTDAVKYCLKSRTAENVLKFVEQEKHEDKKLVTGPLVIVLRK